MRAIECVFIVACALLRAHAAEPSCPVCSKYHYDEMVLERMIRNEIKWEQIVNDIKSINEKVNSALDDTSAKIEQLTSKLEIKNQVVDEASVKIENLTLGLDKQNQVVYEASVKIQNLAMGLEKQKLHMDIINQRSQNLTNVLFQARTPKDAALTSASQIAIFNTVVVNTGQGYASDTGKFTAPVSGIYMFAVQYCSDSSNWGCLKIVKDGTSLQTSVSLAGSMACSSMQAFATVAVGEQVWVQSNGYSACSLYENHPYYWSSFSGVLIHA
ncbi:heavy metal-binding protein HIP-like [Dreissena polymorpha]|uniref:C1q domain-containing protein n=1 Tax=Dreissena polymorpha TaxID=45954 RepID=A0A9D4JFC2_DREPO|nr:heavy metal-binding protein HIP-like [Dreissena polymorpha]KAH3809765.1 hypothetical protein DPMN_138144 [Dreissena polymorpha]